MAFLHDHVLLWQRIQRAHSKLLMMMGKTHLLIFIKNFYKNITEKLQLLNIAIHAN